MSRWRCCCSCYPCPSPWRKLTSWWPTPGTELRPRERYCEVRMREYGCLSFFTSIRKILRSLNVAPEKSIFFHSKGEIFSSKIRSRESARCLYGRPTWLNPSGNFPRAEWRALAGLSLGGLIARLGAEGVVNALAHAFQSIPRH